jgi:glucose-1-phosphate adenylyltransferase
MSTLAESKYQFEKRIKFHHPREDEIDMGLVASIILGGGEGKRLFPLTQTRCKPAICFGGKYRLIDVPISNSIHAGCHKIFLLTQFLSTSLHRHVFHTYQHVGIAPGYIEILSAEQKPKTKEWYQGTADAVRQNIEYLIDTPVDYFLILSGDQLYNLDFTQMLQTAKRTNADVLIAALPVSSNDASRLGILKIDDDGFIIDFVEKPQERKILEQFRSPVGTLSESDVQTSSERPFLGSMGIYLFKKQALIDLLNEDSREDFGKHLIPTQIAKGNIAAYLYDGHWEDIGTIESFYQANIALTRPNPPFDLYAPTQSIYSCRYDVPPAKIFGTKVTQAIICEGSIVEATEVTNSILGPRTVVKDGCIIQDSYIIGNDFYEAPQKGSQKLPSHFGIGSNTIIKRSIVDKHSQIGKNVQLINKKNLINYDGDNIFIRDGIIIVPSGTTIPDGFIL